VQFGFRPNKDFKLSQYVLYHKNIDEMKYVVERWRMDYNHYRPHSSLAYMTLAAFAELYRQTDCVRPHIQTLDKAETCGILS